MMHSSWSRFPIAFVATILFASALGLVLLAQKTQQEQPPPPSPPPTPPTTLMTPTTPMAQDDSLPPAVAIDAADYPSLQTALDALPVSGGVVRIPPGIHELSEPLIVRSGDTRIEGCGSATHLRNLNRTGQPALFIRPEAWDSKPRERLWRIEVCDLRISGNPDSGPGVRAVGVHEFLLRSLAVDRHGSHGIVMDRCEENPRVIGCNLTYNNGSGLHLLGGHDIVVSGNQFEENLDALTLLDGFNLTFTGNNVDDHLRHGVVIENSYGSVISGNMIEECAGTAIILDRGCYGIAVSGNAIAHHLGGGIDLRGAWGCTVTGNNFVLVHQFAVRVSPGSGRHTISGNQFTNSYVGDGKLKRAEGIRGPDLWHLDACAGVVLDQTEAVVINGNQFSGLTTRAVEARGACKRLLVTNNLVIDHGRGLAAGTSSIEPGEATDSLFEANLAGPQVLEAAP
jgi:parallel beta-helix repeat protein